MRREDDWIEVSCVYPLVAAKAGTQLLCTRRWIPAFAGMSGNVGQPVWVTL